MTDSEQLQRLFISRSPLVAVQTFEEDYVLGLVRELALELRSELWIWSATDGLHEGLLSGATPIPDTEKPGAALYTLAHDRRAQGIYVFLDLAGHLRDERTLRCLREAVEKLGKNGSQIILIDQSDSLPPVVAATAAKFIPSLPDAKEIQDILKTTLRQFNEQRRIEVHLSHEDLQTVIRNLQGLTRRQARQIILDIVCVDCRFDASDINRLLAEKRKAIASDGVLITSKSPSIWPRSAASLISKTGSPSGRIR